MLDNIHDITPQTLRDLLTDTAIQSPITTAEIDATEAALTQLAQSTAIVPPLSVREKILGKMQRLNAQKRQRQTIALNNPPLLTPESNWLDWAEAAKGIAAPEDLDNVHLHPLREDDQVQLFVAYVREFVEEEVHHDLIESFILLEGTCECHMTRSDGSTYAVRMQAGDYIEMKLGELHDIQITSLQPAKAILQWLQVAA
jgi:mannose-6-phosphate isomerase-like protein (cupin superfamily)